MAIIAGLACLSTFGYHSHGDMIRGGGNTLSLSWLATGRLQPATAGRRPLTFIALAFTRDLKICETEHIATSLQQAITQWLIR